MIIVIFVIIIVLIILNYDVFLKREKVTQKNRLARFEYKATNKDPNSKSANFIPCTLNPLVKNCVRFDHPISLVDQGFTPIQTIEMPPSLTEGIQLPIDVDINCRKWTGQAVLVQIGAEANAEFMFLCRCRYPKLVTQVNLFSACDVNVGCQPPNGVLAYDVNSDPFINGRCISKVETMIGDHDLLKGPFMRSRLFGELNNDPIHYECNLPITSPVVKPSYQEIIPHNRTIANPCKYDYLTGKKIASKEVGLIKDANVGYCTAPYPSSYIIMRTNDSFLNNYEKANAVYKLENVNVSISILHFKFENVDEAMPVELLMSRQKIITGTFIDSIDNTINPTNINPLALAKTNQIYLHSPPQRFIEINSFETWNMGGFDLIAHRIVWPMPYTFYRSPNVQTVPIPKYDAEILYHIVDSLPSSYIEVPEEELIQYRPLAVMGRKLIFNHLAKKYAGTFVIDFDAKTLEPIETYRPSVETKLKKQSFNFKSQKNIFGGPWLP